MKFFTFFFLLPLVSLAHPGIGIVQDSKGNIFYTDLSHVWKIDRKGSKSIAVKNVHTHELYLDKADNLYGQHSMYSGEATNTWKHYVWKLDADGKLDTIVKPTDGFYIENFSFVHDRNESFYWIRHWKEDVLMKTDVNGKSEEIAKGDFKSVQWMLAVNDKLFYLKGDDVYVYHNNEIKIFAKNLSGKNIEGSPLYGLWTDAENNIYIPDFSLKKVHKVDVNGNTSTYYTFENGWLVTGGLFDKENKLWLLESSPKNEVRVRKVESTVLKNNLISIQQNIFWIVGVLVLILFYFLFNFKKSANFYYKSFHRK